MQGLKRHSRSCDKIKEEYDEEEIGEDGEIIGDLENAAVGENDVYIIPSGKLLS